ncbi:GIY-YIG nuclease family protein [Edaphobacter sp.]|uniref:GIY-YIG nuclease family protein n=1 Tax=Edaphobacter sp. TaxID=1934404 RepID=UPI002DB5E340|nr:GIY-YIG nuclease family protein [Edaphobacter sp.]HEU5341369.1 GIY-YIG nuclease family protein [Edaphobacter sp.]
MVMIGKAERKEAAREFKERKPLPGIFAIRCASTGRRWVDASPNLAAAENSQFFQLRQGLHRNKELQAEWNTHGERSFNFEVLEALPEDTPSLNLRDLLAERRRVWAEAPQA